MPAGGDGVGFGNLVVVGGFLAGLALAVPTVERVVLGDLRSQPERRERWRDIIQGGADVFRSQSPIPCNLLIFDDIVLIKKSGPEPIQDSYAVPIKSENETVRSWAHDLIDRCRADATRVDVETFAEDPAVP